MKKIEIITRPEKLEEIKAIVEKLGQYSMTVSMVSGCGLQKGRKEVYRGVEVSINLLPKVKIEMVVGADKVDMIIDNVCKVAQTGEVGDGKIFVYNIEEVVRIRTGEKGTVAI